MAWDKDGDTLAIIQDKNGNYFCKFMAKFSQLLSSGKLFHFNWCFVHVICVD